MVWRILSAFDAEDPSCPRRSHLGADRVEGLVFVRLPLMTPGIVIGAIIVFVLSITDFVLTSVTTSANRHCRVHLLGSTDVDLPGLGAASALFIGIATLVFIVVLRIGGVDASSCDEAARELSAFIRPPKRKEPSVNLGLLTGVIGNHERAEAFGICQQLG